jgi:hypothetical protein
MLRNLLLDRVLSVPQSRLKGEPLRFLLLPGWLSAPGGTDDGEPLGPSGYCLSYYPYYPRRGPRRSMHPGHTPHRGGLASGIVVTYSPGPLAASAPRYMGEPTIHGGAHDSWGSPRFMGKPMIHGEAQTFDPNLEPKDGDDEALDDVRVVWVRSIRVKTSADGAPHVVDAKAVDPAPLLEALADKHLTSFTTPRTTSRFCALTSATSTAGPSPTHDAGGPGLFAAAPLRRPTSRTSSGAFWRSPTSGSQRRRRRGLRRLPRPDGALVRRHPEIIRVGWRQRSQERSRRYEE